jgi:protein-S-isoprenylcysteine O-methyltransferase Ste14
MTLQDWSRIARRIRVPMGFLFTAVFLWHLYYVPPTYRSLVLSLLLVVPGGMLRAYASGYVKKNAELATTGPYAYTRNPLYLGSMLMAFGFAGASRSLLIVALLAILFAIIYIPTILSEEAYLRTAFPEFSAYAQRVHRLIPRILPRKKIAPAPTPVTAGSFSAALYAQHREYNSALGAIAVYAALLLRILLEHRHL